MCITRTTKIKVSPAHDEEQNANVETRFVSFPMKNKEEVKVDWLGRFIDPQIQAAYLDYCALHQTPHSFFALSAAFLLWAFLETSASLTVRSQESHEMIFDLVSFLIILICLLFGSLIFSYNTQKQVILCISRHSAQLWFTIFFNFLFLSKTAKYLFFNKSRCLMSVVPLMTVVDADDSCDRKHFPFAAAFLPAPEMMFIISYFALFLPILLHKPRLYYLSGNLFVAFAFFIYCFHKASFGNIYPLILTEILVVVLFCNFHHERMQGYLHYRHYQLYFQEQQKLDEIKAENTEIRQMVGNVAHDLKTPLASFTNGVNVIHELLKKSQETIRSLKAAQADSLTEIGVSIESCLMNIQNTNAFMLMSINRVLDFTKIGEKRKLTPKYETIDLQNALQFPVDCMSNIQEKIEIELAPLHDDICSHIITDKQWLQENILCLLSNAVKYSSEGKVIVSASVVTQYSQAATIEMRNPSPPPLGLAPIMLPSTLQSSLPKSSAPSCCTITKTSRSTARSSTDRPEVERSNSFQSNRSSADQFDDVKSYLLFEVEDNGIGMSIEAQASLFSPFQQAQSSAGGTGLGLFSLSKRIEALKGTYGVRSRKDGKKGSLFWFSIPYRPDHVTATAPVPETPPSNTRASLKSIRTPKVTSDVPPLELLLVDDSPSIVKMASMMLKRQGHVTTSAENGEIALKKIEEKWKSSGKGFDLVLMDLQMPVMDGLEATRRLRQMESEGLDWMKSYHGFPAHQLVFGTSANYDEEIQQEGLEAGIDDFLDKPFTLDSLVALLQIHRV